MPDIYRPVDWTVQNLVSSIASGALRLPDLQRPFVWPATKVRDLLDSMYRGYPVGELMFWNQHESADAHVIGGSSKSQASNHLIVDGQQRLTSLFVAVTGEPVVDDDYRKRRIRISFNPLLERFEVAQPALDKSAEWVPDVSAVFTSPMAAHRAFVERLTMARPEPVAQAEQERVFDALNRLHGLQQRIFKVVEIQPSVSKATVAEVFVRINSEGVNLTSADFILTWLSVFWPEGREQLEEFARRSRMSAELATEVVGSKVTWTPKNHFLAPSPGQLVRVAVGVGQNRGRLSDAYSALRALERKTGQTDSVRQTRELDLLKSAVPLMLNPLNWDEFIRVLSRAGFRSRRMITSNTSILYCYAFWLIGLNKYEVEKTELRELMAKFFFMIQTSGRYTSSPESKFQSDLDRLDGVSNAAEFRDVINGFIETTFTTDYWTIRLPDAFITSSTSSPGFQAYLASLDILDADLFMLPAAKIHEWTDPTATNVRNVEIHHIFPKAYLRTIGITDTKRMNQVANYAPIDWVTNGLIGDGAPGAYYPPLLAARPSLQSLLAKQQLWHALPDGWFEMSYEEFLVDRRRRMANLVRQGFSRLSDPSYEPALDSGDVATDSAMDETTLLDLVASGLLAAGAIVESIDSGDDIQGEITEDGEILFEDHRYESPDRAAAAAGAESRDGWDYWTVSIDGVVTTLSELRRSVTIR